MGNDKKFEYLIDIIKKSDLGNYFNNKGNEGWELCDTIPFWEKGKEALLSFRRSLQNVGSECIECSITTFDYI